MADATLVEAVAATRDRVREYMQAFVGDRMVEELENGDIAVRYGSARVTVHTQVFDEDSSLVVLDAPLVSGVTLTPDVYEHVATAVTEEGIGHLCLETHGDGTATIHFRHSLLGEYLEGAELRMSVVAVALLGDQMDDELAARFGGTTFYPTND